MKLNAYLYDIFFFIRSILPYSASSVLCENKLKCPNSNLFFLCLSVATINHPDTDYKNKDWVFINYTYKRFEGLTARGAIPSYMKTGK